MKNVLREKLKTENIVAVLMLIVFLAFPGATSAYGLIQFTKFLPMVVLALSLTLVWGYAGIFSFCQATFFGVGAYVYAVLYKLSGNAQLTILFALAAIAAAAAFAAILGLFMFYGGINDVFVGLITLLVTVVVYKFMQTATGVGWQIQGATGTFDLGGWTGMSGLPRLQLGSVKMTDTGYFYFILAIVAVLYLVMRHLQSSKIGFGILAVRENRSRSELFGYNVPKLQTAVFAIGGAIAALAGVLYVGCTKRIAIENISVSASTIVLVIIATAGRKNATAAVLFTIFYYWFDNKLSAMGSQIGPIVIGMTLILVIRFLPAGLLQEAFNGLDFLGRRLKALLTPKNKTGEEA